MRALLLSYYSVRRRPLLTVLLLLIKSKPERLFSTAIFRFYGSQLFLLFSEQSTYLACRNGTNSKIASQSLLRSTKRACLSRSLTELNEKRDKHIIWLFVKAPSSSVLTTACNLSQAMARKSGNFVIDTSAGATVKFTTRPGPLEQKGSNYKRDRGGSSPRLYLPAPASIVRHKNPIGTKKVQVVCKNRRRS